MGEKYGFWTFSRFLDLLSEKWYFSISFYLVFASEIGLNASGPALLGLCVGLRWSWLESLAWALLCFVGCFKRLGFSHGLGPDAWNGLEKERSSHGLHSGQAEQEARAGPKDAGRRAWIRIMGRLDCFSGLGLKAEFLGSLSSKNINIFSFISSFSFLYFNNSNLPTKYNTFIKNK